MPPIAYFTIIARYIYSTLDRTVFKDKFITFIIKYIIILLFKTAFTSQVQKMYNRKLLNIVGNRLEHNKKFTKNNLKIKYDNKNKHIYISNINILCRTFMEQ